MPIIGKGSIAKMLNDNEWTIFYAAGVSNSSCKDNNEFAREAIDLITNISKANFENKILVYFSTISIFIVDSAYTRHKKRMEEIIRTYCNDFSIVRLGNIWECTNPNTFRNYIRTKRVNNQPVTIRGEEIKYMISKEQLLLVVDNLPVSGKNEICIFGELLRVKDIL